MLILGIYILFADSVAECVKASPHAKNCCQYLVDPAHSASLLVSMADLTVEG